MLWEEYNEFTWIPEGASLVKVPLIPKYLPELDEFLEASNTERRYSAGANIAWIAWYDQMTALDQKLKELNLMGLTILGPADKVRLGAVVQNIFYKKIKTALDPAALWVEV